MSTVDAALEWIRHGVAVGYSLASALPAGFAVYGVLDLDDAAEQDLALLDALCGRPTDVVLAGRIVRNAAAESEAGDEHVLYSGWRYRIRLTSLGEVRRRVERDPDPHRLPDLLLPPDRDWMVTTLWDDGWRSVGASAESAARLEHRLPGFERLPRDRDLRETGRELR